MAFIGDEIASCAPALLKQGSVVVADSRVINRIYRAEDTDTKMIEHARKIAEQSAQVLKENFEPDTFLGRKTQEPFPLQEEE